MSDSWRMKVADVMITDGPSNYRIYQQNANGRADIEMSGTYEDQPGAHDTFVQVRIVSQQDYAPLPGELGRWQRVENCSNGRWSFTLRGVPAGGLYMIQTMLKWTNNDGTIGGRLGHIVRHLGVGDLWIIAGQSNSSGTGRGMAVDPPALGVHILQNDETWQLAAHPLDDPTATDHPNRGGYPGSSPYLSFARILKETLGYPIGLVQTAKGGSSLRMWHVEEDPNAPLWHNLMFCARLAGGRFRGMLWYQGCSDGADGNSPIARNYAARFKRWMELVQAELGKMPVLLTQLNVRSDVEAPECKDLGWSLVREAQRQIGSWPDCYVVPGIGLPMSDGIHNGAAGNVILGERLARAALSEVYARPRVWKSPNIISARRQDNGRTVLMEFENVTSMIIFVGRGLTDFRVEDSAGVDEVVQAKAVENTVLLTLQRPLEGEAFVHGGYGYNPQVTLCDYETSLPMLCFHGVKVD